MANAQSAPLKTPFFDVATFDVATACSKGSRNYQEDTLLTDFALGQPFGYAILADGMGGQAGGDVASAIVASEMFLHLKANIDDVEDGSSTLPAILRDGAQKANARVASYGKDKPGIKGMGSTLVLSVFSGTQMHWISIGDSPLLLFRGGELSQLNKDHSMAPQIDMMVKTGIMDPEVAKDHPDRNILTSVLNGCDEINQIDCPDGPMTLLPGDVIVAASDGLQFLTNEKIAETISQCLQLPSAKIADALLSEVIELNAPDQDNVAFAVIKLGGAEQNSVRPSGTTPRKKTGLISYFSRDKDGVASDSDGDGSKYYSYRGQSYKE